MILTINNSFCKLDNCTNSQVKDLLREVMTYQNDIEGEKANLFYQMKIAKSRNNGKQYHACKAKLAFLEKNEFVCLYKNDKFPTGLLNIALAVFNTLKVQPQVKDLRIRPESSQILRMNNALPKLRYYQEAIVTKALEAGRGVIEAAVGSGKSVCIAAIVKELAVRSLVVVPSRGLSDQLYQDFATWFGANNVEMLDAKKIRSSKKAKMISICTVQSLASLKKSGEFKDFAKDIELVIYDEFHRSAATSYTCLQDDLEHVYYRYGFTGTYMRADAKTLEMWGILSNVLYEYPAHQAITEGYLTPMEVYVHIIPGQYSSKYQTEYDRNLCGNPVLLERVYRIIEELGPNKQVLILCNKKDKSGLLVYEYLKTYNLDVAYISGDNDKSDITDTIRAFNDKQIQVLIGSAVIAEGIDVRSTDHLINLKGGKSEVVLIQAMGRAVRKYEGKEVAYVHDFKFEGTRFLEKHLDLRLQAIHQTFRPKTVTVVEGY